jgi:hypothetical protein
VPGGQEGFLGELHVWEIGFFGLDAKLSIPRVRWIALHVRHDLTVLECGVISSMLLLSCPFQYSSFRGDRGDGWLGDLDGLVRELLATPGDCLAEPSRLLPADRDIPFVDRRGSLNQKLAERLHYRTP